MAESAKLLPSFVESDATKAHGLGSMELERWQQLADQLLALHDLDAPVDATQAFVNLGT